MPTGCFCGCGRTIGTFPLGMRSINKRGHLVAERLSWGSALAAGAPHLNDWIADGEMIVSDLQDAVHGLVDRRSLDESRLRDWQAHGRSVERVAVDIGLASVAEWNARRSNQSARDDQGREWDRGRGWRTVRSRL